MHTVGSCKPTITGFCGLLKVCDDLNVDGLLASQLPSTDATVQLQSPKQPTQHQGVFV